MAWTCPHCHEIVDEPASGSIRFCLHCGQPSKPDATRTDIRIPDGALRACMLLFGLVWLLFFFLPYGRASYGMVMSWDLLANREGMSYLVSWPLMLSILFIVLGAVTPFPAWLRSGTGAVLGTAFLVVLGAGEPDGPMGPDLGFVLMGGVAWVLMFPVMGAGLWLRTRSARPLTARILIGLALLLGLIAYLSGSQGESTLVGALLRYLGEDRALGVLTRILILLPFFLLLASTVGFRLPDGQTDPARRWSKFLAWVWMLYLPAFLLLYGLISWAAEDSGYFFVMFLRMAAYLGGLTVLLVLSVTWLTEWIPGLLIPLIKRLGWKKSPNLD